jgi:hypothetical protein
LHELAGVVARIDGTILAAKEGERELRLGAEFHAVKRDLRIRLDARFRNPGKIGAE